MPLKRPLHLRDEAPDQQEDASALKRRRPCPGASSSLCAPPPSRDIISALSDELLVRIFGYMDERALLGLSPVSKRFQRIASDSQLWRPHYYHRFILPRAHRIPGFRPRPSPTLAPSTADSPRRCSRLLLDAPGVSSSGTVDQVDWKKQYKLRHNWSRGRCAVDQVPVRHVEPSPPPESQTLVKVVEGLAVTVDTDAGLRAWDLRPRKDMAQADLGLGMRPTCLAVDDQRLSEGLLGTAVGFQDGTFGIWRLHARDRTFVPRFMQTKSHFGPLVAIAYSHPYVLTATQFGFISLYTFDQYDPDDTETEPEFVDPTQPVPDLQDALLPDPLQLTSLKSHSTRMPLALSIRRAAASVIASIVYTFDAVGGWAIGIQDLDIHRAPNRSRPDVVSSRVAFTLPTQTRKSATPSPMSSPTPLSGRWSNPADDTADGPIRLCYSHPYLLATLPDNCMVLHLCTSTATSLSIAPGIRLWGHTSGISDAEITPRGKAVSVSTRGDEIRLWELEGRVGGSSVEVRPRSQDGKDHEGLRPNLWGLSGYDNLPDKKNWVGFDNEVVVVLKESGDGSESLVVYDFT
ncbi:hypothetical protein HIM_06298 [Hirsutella minnesotensis 3608]|uniref:F-box domain-containing protein n=1 Tax=Hirsutella minnesotensis 3608 TaxID=1043627 RepID=A0A0F7ZZI7_9HYPO|nr:hypothetical protein HIM_06298 [Hirsutella minnesotensis 3608]